MTQYLLSVHSVEGAPARPDEVMQQAYRDVSAFNAELRDEGAWVFAGGLEPAGTARVVTAEGGKPLVTDGPFAEGKEHIGGFWVIEADDADQAIALAVRASTACAEAVEVRPFQSGPEA